MDCRIASFILSNRIDPDQIQFRFEFLDQPADIAADRNPVLECPIYQRSEFISGHAAVTAEVTIRIPFDDALRSQLMNGFICPMIGRYIREFFAQCALYAVPFADKLIDEKFYEFFTSSVVMDKEELDRRLREEKRQRKQEKVAKAGLFGFLKNRHAEEDEAQHKQTQKDHEPLIRGHATGVTQE